MKSIKIKLKFSEITALDAWLSAVLEDECWNKCSNSEKSVCAQVKIWQLSKLKPKTYFWTNVKIAFKMDAPLAFAMAHIIAEFPINRTDYLGNSLLRIAGEIDQHFQ